MPLDWKVISQRNWLKGLQATFARFSQPQGIITRLSNLLYDVRGGLRTCDGSFKFTELAGATDHEGPIIEIVLYSPFGQQPYYVGIMKSQASHIAAPVPTPPLTFIEVGGAISHIDYLQGSSAAVITFTAPHGLTANSSAGQLVVSGNSFASFNKTFIFSAGEILSPTTLVMPFTDVHSQTGTGGTLTTGLGPTITSGTVFSYVVTASDGQGGETQASAVISGAGAAPQNAIQISWDAVPGAIGYNVYGRSGGSFNEINQRGNQLSLLITGTSYVDLGVTPFTQSPPTANTTQTVVVYRMDAPAFSTILGTFPSYFTPPLGSIPGASSPVAVDVEVSATPQGGVPGATQPLPQIVQFADKLIFALGNGYPPQEYLDLNSGGTGAMVPVPNNFSANYTDWQASVAWNQGDTIKDSVSGGLFTAQQAGTSGTTRPTFHNTLNALTPENSPGTVVWKCVATQSTGTPLRGAAHAIVYAGSLWIANTWPTTTDDQLDGPNCIKMSDVNNPHSWNPANIAFLSKDDGDQITGLSTYTIAQAGIAPTGTLVVWKNFSTFQITGVFGANDFSIQQAQTDMGNIAGRSAQFIPGFGICRLTHLGFAYFNGVNDKLISEEIRPYIFGGLPDLGGIDWNFAYLSKGAQAANPPMYVAACPIVVPVLDGIILEPGTGFFVLFVRVEKLQNGVPAAVSPETQIHYESAPGFTITTPAAQPGVTYRAFAGYVPSGENLFIEQDSFNAQDVLLTDMTPGFLAFGNGGLTRIFAYDLVMKQWAIVDLPFSISSLKQIRSPGTIPITVAGGSTDGRVRRLFSGDIEWDDGSQVLWSFRGGELFQQGGSAKMFYRRLVIRGSNDLQSQLIVRVGLSGTDAIVSNGVGRLVLGGEGKEPQWEMRIDIMKDAENVNAQIFGSGPAQIKIDSLDWYVKPKASGAPVTIQK